MYRLLAVFVLVVAAQSRAGTGGDVEWTPPPRNLLFGYIPRPELGSLKRSGLLELLDVVEDSLEVHRTAEGSSRITSRLAAPTLHASNELCRNHTQIYWQQVTSGKMELWALKLLDSTGKLPDGILVGNSNAFGAWDECLNTEAMLKNDSYPHLPPEGLYFRGRYTPVGVVRNPASVQQEVNYDLQDDGEDDGLGAIAIGPLLTGQSGTIGVCVPSSCSSEDVREGLQGVFGDNFTVLSFDSKSYADERKPFGWGDIFVITLMAIVGYLLAVGTLADAVCRYCRSQQAAELQMSSVADSVNQRLPSMMHISRAQPERMVPRKSPTLHTGLQFFLAFSLYTNLEKLLDTRRREGTLACLHGIRFISMTWVVIGHATMFTFVYTANPSLVVDWDKTILFEAISNATPSVDTFFLLSGLLLSYGFCTAYEKTKKFNVLIFYLHRIIRLTPALAMLVGIGATWYSYIGEGPLWPRTANSLKYNCVHYGWRDILYINNFFPNEQICIGQAWYLSNDMQMFLFSPLVLLPLVWRPKLGALWLAFLTVVFVIIRVIIWDIKDMPPTIFFLNPSPNDPELNKNYGYPWMRCSVWLLGVGLGYLLYRLRGRKISLHPLLTLAGWLAATAIGLLVIYGIYDYQMPWEPYSKATAVAYGGLHRFAWGAAVSWVIFACVTGHGGWVDTFLSHSSFVPLSRLTYSTYLVHILVIQFADSTLRGVIYVDVFRLVYRLLAHLIVSLAVAVVFSLAFEVPFMNLEKLLLTPSTKRKVDI